MVDVRAEAHAHDEQLRRRGLELWIGGEPTFTRRESIEPEWLHQAEGSDKLARARAMLASLGRRLPDGASLHRVVGRQFPDEPAPRFAWGARWPRTPTERDDAPLAGAPSPPALDAPPADPPALAPDDAWLTITPDPGVVEVNLAPCPTLVDFIDQLEAVWAAAADAGLAAFRYRFNGDVTDSGGGGQLTLGGATPDTSPFFRHPDLLPAVIRYLNNHPCLSYWFAGECVGSAGQAPRPDEGVRERFDELGLTLEWLEHLADRGELERARLWQALAPLLVDASGNSHRAELNVEKLWNPQLAGRGQLGVIELRALRMPSTPAMLIAAAALFRAVVARCAVDAYRAPLVDWHDELHDAWALPHFLAHDLRRVLGDLDDHGLGLPAGLRRQLEAWRTPGVVCRLGGATLELTRAVEFWPLVGDTASQERRTARVVDASSERLQVTLHAPLPDAEVAAAAPREVAPPTSAWIVVGGRRVDLRADHLASVTHVIGLRRRAWSPSPGLHPGLPAQDPMEIVWGHGAEQQRITLHGWRPGGGPYPGLPVDASEAARRRVERVEVVTLGEPLPRPRASHRATARFTVDLRRPGPEAGEAAEAAP